MVTATVDVRYSDDSSCGDGCPRDARLGRLETENPFVLPRHPWKVTLRSAKLLGTSHTYLLTLRIDGCGDLACLLPPGRDITLPTDWVVPVDTRAELQLHPESRASDRAPHSILAMTAYTLIVTDRGYAAAALLEEHGFDVVSVWQRDLPVAADSAVP